MLQLWSILVVLILDSNNGGAQTKDKIAHSTLIQILFLVEFHHDSVFLAMMSRLIPMQSIQLVDIANLSCLTVT